MVHVILSIDTEGDNLWADQRGRSFDNIEALGEFQTFCEGLGLRPTYLVAHEVIADEKARDTILRLEKNGNCEIGSHLHAWLTPPPYAPLDELGTYPFLHEYPQEMRAAKLERLTEDLEDVLGRRPTSYRGGRWSIEAFTMGRLESLGYAVDTTVTPFVSWIRTLGAAEGGPNCTTAPHTPYYPHSADPMRPGAMRILEVPTSHRPPLRATDGLYRWAGSALGGHRWAWSVVGRGLGVLIGKVISPNPAVTPTEGLLRVAGRILQEEPAVLNLCIHSSELVAGGAPWIREASDAKAVRQRFRDVVGFLSSRCEWRALTLSEYAREQGTSGGR
ncbi:MAG: hypothetical protein HPY69_01515 [Armatimonadetes bacterium]|nr:hypothetical protein [Armatimonadota bacterium]